MTRRERRVGRVVALVVTLPFLVGLATAAAEPGTALEEDVAFSFTDPEIVESSGLVARDGLFWTVNDSGDTGRVFVVDPATGDTVGVTTWGDATDVEAVAPVASDEALIGDIGDNARARESIRLLRVPVGRDDRDVEATSYDLVYPDGPQDAEALLVHPVTGQVLVVTKGIFSGVVHEAPAELSTEEPNELTPLGDVLSVVTDGAFFPDGRHLVLRDYTRAVVYTWPRLQSVGELELPEQEQGEGIAVDEDGEVFVSSEGVSAPVLRVELPARVRRAMAATDDAGGAGAREPDGALGAEDSDDAASGPVAERPVWPWALGGLVGVGMVVVLVRSLRPR